MLSYMRKNAKSWIIIIPVGIIILVFVFFYGFSDVRKGGEDTIVASIGKRKVTMGQYRTAYKNMLQFYRNIYKNQFSEEMIENLGLKQKVLEDLIDRELLLTEAQRLNIHISPEEIKNAILSTPFFQENGVFSQRLYERVLSFYGMSALDYEREKEMELKLKRLEEMIKNTVQISDNEIREVYNLQNTTVKIEYVCFEPDKIQQKPEVIDEELKQYYEDHKEKFRVPDKVKVSYLVFDPQMLETRAAVSQEEITEYYEADPQQFHEPQTVKARHILFKVEEKATEQEQAAIKEQAAKVLEQITSGENFEALAKKHSEDSASAEKGGELGYFKQGDMVKPFEQAAFSLKPGETSSLVRTKYGFHIIRVEDIREARTKSLDEVKDVIDKDLRKEKAQELVRKEARRAFNRLFKSKDIESYAEKNEFTLLQTDYFAYGNAPEDVPGKDLFSKEAFALSPGELAPAFAIGQKYFLVKLTDKQETHIPPVEEVRTSIQSEIVKEKKIQLAKQRAEKVLEELREEKQSWQELEQKYGVQIKEAEFKRPGDYVSGIGMVKELKDAAFTLEKPNQYGPAVFPTDKGSVIVRVREKDIPGEAMFEQDKEKTAQTTLQQKQTEVFNQFLQQLKSKADLWVDPKMVPSV